MPDSVHKNIDFSLNPLLINEFEQKSDYTIKTENQPFRHVLEISAGSSFLEKARKLFDSRGIEIFDEEYFVGILNDQIADQRYWEWVEGWSVSELPDCDKHKLFKQIFDKACTDTYLNQYRDELSSWIKKIEKGKALFVDCLMGVGKTYSIVKTLGQNPDISAVIFMPTNKLCKQMVQDLKREIIRNDPNLPLKYPRVIEDEEAVDENDKGISDRIGLPTFEYTREFLEREVYHADGINEKECPNFLIITKRYRENWIAKRDICQSCEKKTTCRFILHNEKAPLSRIVITTHHQYDLFYNNREMRKWYKNGHENKHDALERDFFIVDEDIVLSQCYQPIYLKYKEIQEFLTTVRDFIDQYSGSEETNEKIFKLFGRVGLCKETSLIRPIDPDFRFPDIILKEWNESTQNLLKVFPNISEQPESIGNHLEMIEGAIRLGLVVQKYPNQHRIYFYNRKSYDLSNLPPHVFFDGTMINKRFLKKKLRDVELKRVNIPVKPLWNLKVWQNINTDLPIKGIRFDRKKVEGLLQILLNALGPSHKYLILSSKATRTEYLENFLKQTFPLFDFVMGHYGNLRGINDAKDCDIGIMLGSYLPSDAVEITMALEFIQNILPKKAITPTKDYFWTFKGSKGKRVYTRKYNIINKISEALRYSEQRQAMARARYLFHDVDFYVISKDPVIKYEPYAQIEVDKYMEDIFPPRAERPDSKYEEIKETVIKLIYERGEIREMDLHRLTGRSRTTLRKHLRRMVHENCIMRDGKKYTFLIGV
jgi:hypothetical protein